MADNADAMKKVRAEWKREGFCTRCGKWHPDPGYTRCVTCVGLDVLRKRKKLLERLGGTAHSTVAT